MNTRPSKSAWAMKLAEVVATRSTCVRRKVGCVITDMHNVILSTGYNGSASGLKHCIESPCKGAHSSSTEGLHLCEAIHAEQNALMQCPDVRKIDTIYVTTSPCMHCAKMILNTSVTQIYYKDIYDENALDLLNMNNISIKSI